MERQFNNGDFEKLLRDNANQYRMYPSEKVWKGIDSALHSRRRWYGVTAAIMLLITGSIVSLFIFNNKPGEKTITEQKNSISKNTSKKETPVVVDNKQTEFVPEVIETKHAKPPLAYTPQVYLGNPGFTTITTPEVGNTNTNLSTIPGEKNNQPASLITLDKKEQVIELTELLPVDLNSNSRYDKKVEILLTKSTEVKDAKSITDQSLIDEVTDKKIKESIAAIASQNIKLTTPIKRARITGQVFFTPTVSYRSLTENKKIYSGSGYNNYVPVIDLNNVVKHKPAMGLEFGIEGKYRVSNTFSFKTGLQFNINRYDIRAYSHPTEIATVAINSGYRVDSLASLSNYRNFSGNSPNWLENFYFQAAIPLGAEIILSDKNNLQWGISGTFQPTYVIGDRAYVISSDYKNYAKFPNLMRRWNLSTSMGTFVSYSTGRIRWQAGPQVRYQHLSSFVSALTVREKLFSVGLRVGATLNKKK